MYLLNDVADAFSNHNRQGYGSPPARGRRSVIIGRRLLALFFRHAVEAILHVICYAVARSQGMTAIQYLMLLSALFALEWLRFLVQMVIAARMVRGPTSRALS